MSGNLENDRSVAASKMYPIDLAQKITIVKNVSNTEVKMAHLIPGQPKTTAAGQIITHAAPVSMMRPATILSPSVSSQPQMIVSGSPLLQGTQIVSQSSQIIGPNSQIISQSQIINPGGQLLSPGTQIISQGSQLSTQVTNANTGPNSVQVTVPSSVSGQVLSVGGPATSSQGLVSGAGNLVVSSSVRTLPPSVRVLPPLTHHTNRPAVQVNASSGAPPHVPRGLAAGASLAVRPAAPLANSQAGGWSSGPRGRGALVYGARPPRAPHPAPPPPAAVTIPPPPTVLTSSGIICGSPRVAPPAAVAPRPLPLLQRNYQPAKVVGVASVGVRGVVGNSAPTQLYYAPPHTPQHNQPHTPQHSQPHTQPHTPQHTQSHTPQLAQQHTTQHNQQHAPQHTTQHNQQHATQHNQQHPIQHNQQLASQHVAQHNQQHAIQHNQQLTPQHAAQHNQQLAPQHTAQHNQQLASQLAPQHNQQHTPQHAVQLNQQHHQHTPQHTLQHAPQSLAALPRPITPYGHTQPVQVSVVSAVPPMSEALIAALPRPTILRKRDTDGPACLSSSNVNSGYLSGRPGWEDIGEPGSGGGSGGSTTMSAASSPAPPDPDPPREPVREEDMSPRKKPRKQMLSHEVRQCQEYQAEEAPPSPPPPASEPPKRPQLSSTYVCGWRGTALHFTRPADVRRREPADKDILALASQKHVLSSAQGWKVHHLTAQMDDLVLLETDVGNQLNGILKTVEGASGRANSALQPHAHNLLELIKGNIQRSKIVCEGVQEAREDILRVFTHKTFVTDILSRQADKRCFRKHRSQS